MATEKRLIDANALIEGMERRYNLLFKEYGSFDHYTNGYEEAINYVENAPAVDAVEVVHGRWEQVDHDGSWRVDRCSICHRRMHYVDYDQPYAYCPNCGAKMDGGNENGC